MAKQFQKTSAHFDSDLDAILDRVYGKKSDSTLDRAKTPVSQPFVRKDPGSKELKEALAELRNRRERAQGSMRLMQMQEEVDYLREQIGVLRDLGDQIDQLRRRIAIEAGQGNSSTLSDLG
ncbi:hypothetical protein [Allochromatium tepidum]|uniref:Uncharacterized protein n=1 Tax=Allochromatium tepidum TaxID=553982 RepID=A0ABM7QLA1_9GAMM|nr:hypothetical protein [Allochromatium tepidum]BCU06601.1 hypothetical protein Atep_12780 [Allochromatium tepidum]